MKTYKVRVNIPRKNGLTDVSVRIPACLQCNEFPIKLQGPPPYMPHSTVFLHLLRIKLSIRALLCTNLHAKWIKIHELPKKIYELVFYICFTLGA